LWRHEWRERLGIRWYERRFRAIAPQCRWELLEEWSRRTLEEPSDRFRIVGRKENVELVALTGPFANDE
jgi:hypothetical protein